MNEQEQASEQTREIWVKVNGQMLRVGTLAEFSQAILGAPLTADENGRYPIIPRSLFLGLEKFKTRGHRWYSLIWGGREQAWLAAEDQTRYRRHREAVEAGRKLAEQTGAIFDEHSR